MEQLKFSEEHAAMHELSSNNANLVDKRIKLPLLRNEESVPNAYSKPHSLRSACYQVVNGSGYDPRAYKA